MSPRSGDRRFPGGEDGGHDDDIDVVLPADGGPAPSRACSGVRRGVHLPVPGDQAEHEGFLRCMERNEHVRIREMPRPGQSLPSRYSRLAPPPVEQWVTLWATLNFFAAVAVSPPPTIVIAPRAVGLGDRFGHGLGGPANNSGQEHAGGAVPDHGLRPQDGGAIEPDRLGAGVQPHPAGGDAARVVGRLGGGVGGKLVGADVVHREDRASRLAGAGTSPPVRRRSWPPRRRRRAVADFAAITNDLLEGVGHTAADDDRCRRARGDS